MRNSKSVILVIDDEKKIQDIIIDILRYKGYHVEGVSTGNEALEFLGDHNVDLIFLDLKLPDIDGSELIHTIKLNSPLTPIVIISAFGDIPTAVKTTQLGAATFLQKPLDASSIIETVDVLLKHGEKVIQKENLKLEYESKFGMIGISPAIKNVFGTIEKVASTNASVLIRGESGTGKELVAKAIHNQSSRKPERMIRVNCAAIPNDLIESELFGHKKGAFTGAAEDRRGRFELADKGTLFLDEIADMNLLTQSKVLRVLQEKEFEPIGGTETIQTDMRIISATNKNLDREVAEGRFRQDLFFRLNVINIQMPPLRDRKEDIPYLVDHYIKYYCEEYNKVIKRISTSALELLLNRDWPGNVRELINVIQKMVILFDEDFLEERHLLTVFQHQKIENNFSANLTLREAMGNFEREYIFNKLVVNNWAIQKTAKDLGIERTNLYRKIKQHNILVPPKYK